jgi:peroxiredoxin
MRPSAAAIVAGVILAGFTVWITRQAKALERDLDSNALKIALLDRPAPDFHLTASDGHPVSLGDYRGKNLLLVFWATWNNSSHPEMGVLGQMYQRAHTPDSGFEILGVAVDDDPAAVKRFVSDTGLPFPVALDRGGDIASAYQIRLVPTALIVDGSGKISYGAAGRVSGRQSELAERLGINPGAFQFQMGAPRGRGN